MDTPVTLTPVVPETPNFYDHGFIHGLHERIVKLEEKFHHEHEPKPEPVIVPVVEEPAQS